jgi:hypothetical protein
MLKRFPITLLLGLALLFSQGGVLLVAALCPHLRLSAPICDMPKMEPEMDHSQMAHHGTDNPDIPLLAANAESNDADRVIGHSEQSCSHCVIHSRSTSNVVLVRTADISKRSPNLKVPLSVVVPPPIGPIMIGAVTPRDHGPPGKANRPKHVLINTFRI